MQMCPFCDRVYDESEHSSCPYCNDDDDRDVVHIVYDDEAEEVLELSDDEYEEFKKTHEGYH